MQRLQLHEGNPTGHLDRERPRIDEGDELGETFSIGEHEHRCGPHTARLVAGRRHEGALLLPSVERQLRDVGDLSYVQFQILARLGDADDERSTVVEITDAGREALAAVFPGHISTVHGLLFAPITDGDASDLARILGRISERLRSNPPRSAGRRGSK